MTMYQAKLILLATLVILLAGVSPTVAGNCGDVNGNGAGPDIADLVYLVAYMFSSGPAPVECP